MSDLTSTTLIPRISAAKPRRPIEIGMPVRLAWRNLTQDRVRFVVTLVGIVFAVVLMAVQSGLLYGFATTASALIDHAGADFWVTAPGVRDVDQTAPIRDGYRFRSLSVPGVASADKLIIQFADWRHPDGGSPSILVVGFNLNNGVGGPWNLVAGQVEDLRQPDAVVIDELYREKLGVTALGQTFEINGRRARVVGFTHGVRTFTQSPYVFTSFANAQSFLRLPSDRTSYILVRLAPDANEASVRARLQSSLHDVDIWRSSDFSGETRNFWLFTTGAGVAVLTGAILGLVIGIVVTGQTLYATTVDRLPEYATLRAMGAPASYLHRIILTQAVIAGLIGYAIGISVAELVAFAGRNGSAALLLPNGLAIGLAFVTVAMCCAAALLSVRKVSGLQGASVFR